MDKYERIRLLGSGTFGKAWLVRNRISRKLYVIKEIKVAKKKELEEALTEAELLSKLDSDLIVKYEEVIRTGSKIVHIVMEYAEGGDLQARLNRNKLSRKPFTEAEVLTWFTQLCEALFYIHRRGMVHRDIKLANLFLSKEEKIKVGDFGIARVLERNAARISARTCDTPVGTPMYMAPELCNGKPYGQKADVWAVGCVLYELMSYKPAFNAQSMDGLMHRIKRGRYDRALPSCYSQELQNIVHELLAQEANDRPSVKDLLKRPLLQPYLCHPEQLSEADPIQALSPLPKGTALLERVVEESETDLRSGRPSLVPGAANGGGLAPVRTPAGAGAGAGAGAADVRRDLFRNQEPWGDRPRAAAAGGSPASAAGSPPNRQQQQQQQQPQRKDSLFPDIGGQRTPSPRAQNNPRMQQQQQPLKALPQQQQQQQQQQLQQKSPRPSVAAGRPSAQGPNLLELANWYKENGNVPVGVKQRGVAGRVY